MRSTLRLSLRLTVCAVLAAGCLGPEKQGQAAPTLPVADLEAVLDHVREAIGHPTGGTRSPGIRLTGTAHRRGVDDEFELLFTPRGEFVRELRGRFAGAVGYDGTTAWSRDQSGLTRRLDMEDRDSTLLEFWVYTGFWLDPSAPLALELLSQEGDTALLSVRLRDTPMQAELEIDRARWLPTRLARRSDAGGYEWRFADWKVIDGLRVPQSYTAIDSGGLGDVYQAARGEVAPAFLQSPYGFRPGAADNVHFDASRAGAIEVKVAERTGHLLVHPLVDGQDVGWFIFDTGAGAMCIDDDAAEALGMEAFGEETAVGVAGFTTTQFRQGKSFTLGPATMTDTIYVEIELSFLRPFLGVDVAGICGYDFLARFLVELAPGAGTITLPDPDTFVLGGAAWCPLLIDENHPVVRATFEGDHEGPFKLDTGADDTVTFHAPAVDRLQLLEGRKVQQAQAMGVGGAGKTFRGTIAWFELGGHRFDNPTVGFSRVESGAFRDPYTLGNLGQEFLAPFRLVFDYPRQRIAFVKVGGQ